MKKIIIFILFFFNEILCQSITKNQTLNLPNNENSFDNITSQQPSLPNSNDSNNEHSFSKILF